MRRIGVISDTHGLLRKEIVEILRECDAIIHAGDIDRQSIVDELWKINNPAADREVNSLSAGVNNPAASNGAWNLIRCKQRGIDPRSGRQMDAQVCPHGSSPAGIKPLYIVRGNADKEWAENIPHDLMIELFGHTFYIIHNKKEISEQAKGADIVIYGHSHKYNEKEVDGQFWLNPGSCGKRRFTLPVTMAVIEIDEDGSYKVIRKDIAGEKLVVVDTDVTGGRDLEEIIRKVIKEFKKGKPVEDISKRCGISMELAEQICRMYSTHPGINVDGIIDRIVKTVC